MQTPRERPECSVCLQVDHASDCLFADEQTLVLCIITADAFTEILDTSWNPDAPAAPR